MGKHLVLSVMVLLGLVHVAGATTEICGNDIDDDGNGMTDEGCAPTEATRVCESPLSCGLVGMISWTTGALHYDLPPDITPKVPWGPGIGLRRFYTSMYAPGTGPSSVNHTPMGARWQHTYMSWIDHFQVGTTWHVVLHTSEGRDVYGTYSTTTSGWEIYTPQSGFHVMSIKRNTASPNQYQVQLLTGETLYFNSSGQLTQIWDNLKPTPNAVQIVWTSTSGGNVSTVTDASGYRRLVFNYTSNLLTSINYQLLISGTWTTQQTTTYSYTSGTLTSVTIGTQLAQQYSYSGSYLTGITDGAGGPIATFTYNNTTAGKVNRVDTPQGSAGLEYSSARTACSGNTIMYFNEQSTSTTCSSDSDCGGGTYLCGGYTGVASSGRCYLAARCLTTSTANGESVVTSVNPLGHGGGTCGGACASISQYTWSTDPGLLNVLDTQFTSDALGAAPTHTSALYNSNGLPLQITYGDDDGVSNDTNPSGSRTVYVTYDTTYPGRIASTSRHSDVHLDGTCPATSGACATTGYTYDATSGLLSQLQQTGTTYTYSSGAISTTPYTYTTTYTHDGVGRLSEVDGPVSGMKTTLSYYTSTTAPLTYGFLQNYQVYTDATNHLDTSIISYDFWGNVTGSKDPALAVNCRTFDSSRNYLTQTRAAMNGQTDCTTSNSADITTSFVRDSELRLTQVTRPDGSCMFYSYSTSDGRLGTIKRRDDCNASSSGDYKSLSYTTDGQLKEIDTYAAGAGSPSATEQYNYYDSRRLQTIANPANTSVSKYLSYDARGVLTEVDDESGLGKTVYTIASDNRTSQESRYKTSTTYDAWTLLYDWIGDQKQVTDGDSKVTQSVRDDLGRFVGLTSADMTSTTVKLYDAAGRMTSEVEGVVTGGSPRTHSFTFDYAGRSLNDDYANTCWVGGPPPTNTPHPEIMRTYDALPTGVSCPMTGGCNNLKGRLAYVKQILACSTSYADDGSLDQETFYSYDAAGRVVEEYIHDDTNRTADHKYTWTKNGSLSQVITPASATIAWTYDSSTNNSDKDRVTSIAINSTNVATSILWLPFGPLQQYTQANSVAGRTLSTVLLHDAAYRIGATSLQDSASTVMDGMSITEDAKGRVVERDYIDSSLSDSYFLYDNEDHIMCETTSSVSSCPTTAISSIKNSHYASPPFTNAGDWISLLRWNTTAVGKNLFSLNTGTHQTSQVYQQSSALGKIVFTYNTYGDRTSDYGTHWNTHHIDRTYTYDDRHNVVNVRFEYPYWYFNSGCFCYTYTWHYADTGSQFDAKGRRVFKSVHDETTGWTSTTFFYYDALDRLTEIRTWPDASQTGTYTIYQIVWLGQRPVLYYQTDYPGPTVSKRYTVTDETDRIIAMWSWPASGDASRVWEINPTAWGGDAPTVGSSVYQPLQFTGQYVDDETHTYMDDGSTIHQRGLTLNGRRTYDVFAGSYLQVAILLGQTFSPYVYADSNPVGKPTQELASDPVPADEHWGSHLSPAPYSTFWQDPRSASPGNSRCHPGPQYDENLCASCVQQCSMQGGDDPSDPNSSAELRCYLAGPWVACDVFDYVNFMTTCKNLQCGGDASHWLGRGNIYYDLGITSPVCDTECPSQSRWPDIWNAYGVKLNQSVLSE